MMLADMGAEVIKIEERGHGDDTRLWPPFQGGESSYFMSVNRGKKSLTLDLKKSEGRAILQRLIERSDVLLENFRPGTADRLGFGYDTVKTWQPRLIYCSVSGFGESGPEAGRPGYDLIVQGESGLMDLTGFPDGPPVKLGTSMADIGAGIMAAHGIVLSLFARERTGQGQKVEIAMLDVSAALLTYQAGIFFATGKSPTRRGNQHPSIVPYEVFRAQDGYMTIGVANNSLWERFCRAIDRPELIGDPRFASEADRVTHREILIPILEQTFGAKRVEEWLERLDRAGVPAGRIKTVGEVCESPHLAARGMLPTVPHPVAGEVKQIGIPIRLWSTPGEITLPPPQLGEHTEELLVTLLKMSKAEVARLRDREII
jgi:crotonobetainyl-CoA:carnitine CoA-transferase CaiB-like acyl-CoA transferase